MPLRLKNLELHGYKTFASRTLFEFSESITAIVGPNGSGKSNIADSLRWVLGEQSYSLLRGKRTEDMIFSGSEQRARAGMASATVVFDNSDGWLPIDFNEVAITRRAYRDGNNEYLVNGQRVRLKDVSELLAQSGLAERTYTIIGQGLVDAALALKAEERRRLFEEAAGIGLHRNRREEALRRLETTQRNLDRVKDILAELQPRLKSLEKQARRAQEYEQVKADLRMLLRDWYGFHWHRAQRDLTEARDAAHKQETALEKSRLAQLELDGRLGTLRERIQGLRARLNSWHRQSAQLHTQREELIRQRAVSDERLRSLSEQGQSAAAELARLEEDLGLGQERLEAATEEVTRLEAELAEARSQAGSARQALRTRQAEQQKAEASLQAARQELSGLNSRRGALQARLAERQAQAERGQKALQAAEEALTAAQEDVNVAGEHQLQAAKILDAAQASRQTADEALNAHRLRLAQAEADRKAAQEQQLATQGEAARLQAQLEVLDQAEKALSGYASGTQALLKAASQARLDGARGALSSYLEVPVELETAVAAALGDYVDAVLLEKATSAEEALELLAGETARGTVLPLDELVPGEPLSFGKGIGDKGDGIVGLAAQLVGAPPELRPAVDLLLGQALVVRDRPAARRALLRLKQSTVGAGFWGARVVTLNGEVFHAAGPVQAGQGSRGGTLARPRQRRELQAESLALEKRMAESAARLQQAEQGFLTRQAEEQRLVEAQRQARQTDEKAASEHNQTKLNADHAARQLRWQIDQRDHLQADLEQSAVQSAQAQAELARLEDATVSARELVRQSSNEVAELSLDEHQAQVSHWNTLVAVAERALVDARARQGEASAGVERARSALDAMQARQQAREGEAAALEAGKIAQRQAESELAGQIEALRVLIEPAEAELDTAEAEQDTMQAAELTSRQALSQAEHHHAQARILQARRQEALDTLQRRIEDDFGLVAFEYQEDISGPTPLPLEGMVEQLPHLTLIAPDLEENIQRQRGLMRRMGPVNPEAQAEFIEVKERYAFLTGQVADLEKAEQDVHQVIAELDALMEREFKKTFDEVAVEFRAIFTRLFGGGSARLLLTDPDDLTGTGIDIEARLPGRRVQGLSLLSGGERSLTANSLIFALLRVSPTPFCVLDEVDAMLDEANVARFREMLAELSQNTQIIIVTHNRNTVQAADVIYGVTMGRDTASQVVSLKMDEVEEIEE